MTMFRQQISTSMPILSIVARNTCNMTEEQELKRDLWLWVHFCLHDADFIEALRSRYTKEAIDQAIADITMWFTTYINS